MNKKKLGTEAKILWTIFTLFGLAIVALIAAAGSFVVHGGLNTRLANGTRMTLPEETYTQLSSTNVITKIEDSQISDLSAIVEEAMPSIVAITCTTTETYYSFFGSYDADREGSGSGIIFEENEEELFIMTNNHVIKDADNIRVKFQDGSIAEGSVKGTNTLEDLAVVTVSFSDLEEGTKDQIRVAKLGSTDTCRVGQMVLAIGNALGYGQSLTVGYVSAKERQVLVDGRKMVLLQIDAAINPGNSGGALLNMQGEVIGINSVKYTSETVERMGYAIPMETALPIITELKDRTVVTEEERGYLGIRYEEVSDRIQQFYQFPEGIYVSEVLEASPAEKAGIQIRDIITAIDGQAVIDEASMKECMQGYRVGDTVKVTLQRYYRGNYLEKEVFVVLGERPAS